MSNKRSKLWSSKKEQLEKRESKLRGELEEVSDRIETTVKKMTKASLITGGVFLAGYGLYQVFRKSDHSYEAKAIPDRKGVEAKSSAPHLHPSTFKNILLERLASTIMKIVSVQLTLLLSQKLGTKSHEEDKKH